VFIDNCFNTSNTHATVGCNTVHCNSSFSKNELFAAVHIMYSYWLNINMWYISDFFRAFRKLTVSITDI
jgi:hypothetical protein